MKKLARLLSLFGLAAALAACSVAPSTRSVSCSIESIDHAALPSTLREIAEECSVRKETERFVLAISKLNKLPPVASTRMRLQSAAPLGESEQVVFEMDVYFNQLEAYPPDTGVEKIDLFIARLNTAYSIRSVRLIGSGDRLESALESFQLARNRADFVKRYFLAAGMQSDVPVEILESYSKQTDTAEGRAAVRSVSIKVVAYRRRPDAKSRTIPDA